jgi:hypothetical protein
MTTTREDARRDIRCRLERAGFSGIEINEIDVVRNLSGAVSPSDNKMIYVRCWVMPEGLPRPPAPSRHGWLSST